MKPHAWNTTNIMPPSNRTTWVYIPIINHLLLLSMLARFIMHDRKSNNICIVCMKGTWSWDLTLEQNFQNKHISCKCLIASQYCHGEMIHRHAWFNTEPNNGPWLLMTCMERGDDLPRYTADLNWHGESGGEMLLRPWDWCSDVCGWEGMDWWHSCTDLVSWS